VTSITLISTSARETFEAASAFSQTFTGGEVVLLYGELGSGKTVFVQGLAAGLGIDPEEVASPTFVLLTSHVGRLRLQHADLYRLRGDGDDFELGLTELPGRGCVLAIEWAERLARIEWTEYFRVDLAHQGEDRRSIKIEGVK
jgi:tRNA threonylcarbamoyladenosine biosynthesis protein TsaE